eukprot:COSAG02_NODE_52119_length_309_cov_91.057143_1_plen_81_part_01
MVNYLPNYHIVSREILKPFNIEILGYDESALFFRAFDRKSPFSIWLPHSAVLRIPRPGSALWRIPGYPPAGVLAGLCAGAA